MESDPPDPPRRPATPYPPPGTGTASAGWDVGGGTLMTPPATGYKITSLILMLLGGALFLLGLLPCLGWLNWFGVPLNGAAALVGILGLASGPKHPDGARAYQGYYVAALIVGMAGFIGGALRCIAGAGMF
jgi:hypothetical protein